MNRLLARPLCLCLVLLLATIGICGCPKGSNEGETEAETEGEALTEPEGEGEPASDEGEAEPPAEGEALAEGEGEYEGAGEGEVDDLVFIHHSVGQDWLDDSLHDALLAKPYVDERNDITYGTDVTPQAGRPVSLLFWEDATAGDFTDMNHWILWFNDYFSSIRRHACADGVNRIIMFKSCFPNSHIEDNGREPGDPFSGDRSLVNYRAVYRHPEGAGNTYTQGAYTYLPLEDIFAAHPNILFIPVTAPPLHSGDSSDAAAHRARTFNNWLKNDWLDDYTTNTGLSNVAVFDLFDVLAYPDDHATHPNRLREEYVRDPGDSHPNSAADAYSTELFATAADNFLDAAWAEASLR